MEDAIGYTVVWEDKDGRVRRSSLIGVTELDADRICDEYALRDEGNANGVYPIGYELFIPSVGDLPAVVILLPLKEATELRAALLPNVNDPDLLHEFYSIGSVFFGARSRLPKE